MGLRMSFPDLGEGDGLGWLRLVRVWWFVVASSLSFQSWVPNDF